MSTFTKKHSAELQKIGLAGNKKACNWAYKFEGNKVYVFDNRFKINKGELLIERYSAYPIIVDGEIERDENGRYLHKITLSGEFYKYTKRVSEYPVVREEFYKQWYKDSEFAEKDFSAIALPTNSKRKPWIIIINTDFIVKDEIVFDVVQKETDDMSFPLQFDSKYDLTSEQKTALSGYMTNELNLLNQGTGLREFTDDFVTRVFSAKPLRNENVAEYTLYRGLTFDKPEYEKFLKNCKETGYIGGNEKIPSSWTSNICVATKFAANPNFKFGVVLKGVFQKEDILADLRLIDTAILFELFPRIQREVIVRPGKHKCYIHNTFLKLPDDKGWKIFGADGKEIPLYFL